MSESGKKWLRLRQIALMAEELAPAEEEIVDVLGIERCYRDEGVARFGLENGLFPVGNQLLEVDQHGPGGADRPRRDGAVAPPRLLQ